MKVVALQTWSNGTITMEEKSVQDIPDALAEQLIADGICADAAEYFGGGGGDLVIAKCKYKAVSNTMTCDMTYEEIKEAINAGKVVIGYYDGRAGIFSLGSSGWPSVNYAIVLLHNVLVPNTDMGRATMPINEFVIKETGETSVRNNEVVAFSKFPNAISGTYTLKLEMVNGLPKFTWEEVV